METIGKVLRKAGNSEVAPSVYRTTQYEKLAQNPSDEEAEDDVVFLHDGLVLHQNGFNLANKTKNNHHTSLEKEVEMNLLQKGSVNRSRLPGEMIQVKSTRKRIMTRRRVSWCLFLLLLVLGVALVVVILGPYYHRMLKPTKDWVKEFNGLRSESNVRLIDVNKDGILDVIFSASMDLNISISELHDMSPTQISDLCKRLGSTGPCLGHVVALRGRDGHQLWSLNTSYGLQEMNCGEVDVNKDGNTDCIGTGAFATAIAFDPRSGKLFWSVNSSMLVHSWINHKILVLPDFTGDSVPELLLPHSSDLRRSSKKSNISSSRLILLNGATGHSMGRYLEIAKEIHSPPVLHALNDGSQYILFGNGDEESGRLLCVSVPDFYRYVQSLKSTDVVPQTSGAYDKWTWLTKTENQIISEVHRTFKKGISVPPLCVDMNGDGVMDILLLTLDGNLTLFDGSTLKVIWNASFESLESCSSPSPGYFNDDDYLDFMFHLNYGQPNHSMTVVIDGKNGKSIWSLNSSLSEMSSDLVAMTTERHHDFFVFRIRGRRVVSVKDGSKIIKRQVPRSSDDDVGPSSADVRPRGFRPPYQSRRRPSSYGRYRPQSGPDYEDDWNRKSYDVPDEGRDVSEENRPYSNRRRPYPVDNYEAPPELDGDAGEYRYRDGDGPDSDQTQTRYEHRKSSSRAFDEPSSSRVVPTTNTIPTTTTTTATAPTTSKPCTPNTEFGISEIFAVDRSIPTTPFLLHEDRPISFDKDLKRSANMSLIVQSNLAVDTNLCASYIAEDINTGALGDVDGDGSLDLVAIETMAANLFDTHGSFIRGQHKLRISKLNLELKLADFSTSNFVPVDARTSIKPPQVASTRQLDVKFRPSSKQPWTAYMGSRANSKYSLP